MLNGKRGADNLDGGNGDDKLYGGDGDDLLKGGLGKDDLKGGQGDDVLKGKQGNDDLHGGNGDDVLRGGYGKDVLHSTSGHDRLVGGGGADTFSIEHDGTGGTLTTIADFHQNQDKLQISGVLSAANVDELVFTQQTVNGSTETHIGHYVDQGGTSELVDMVVLENFDLTLTSDDFSFI